MSGICLLVTDWYGMKVPQKFIENFEPKDWDVSEEDAEYISKGPDGDCYWDVWDAVMSMAEHIDKDGNVWRLYQDGDLFAYCDELMTNEEYKNLFGEEREAA